MFSSQNISKSFQIEAIMDIQKNQWIYQTFAIKDMSSGKMSLNFRKLMPSEIEEDILGTNLIMLWPTLKMFLKAPNKFHKTFHVRKISKKYILLQVGGKVRSEREKNRGRFQKGGKEAIHFWK